MREMAGVHSLKKRIGLGAWLAVGALLAFGAVQTSLVSAAPAEVRAASGAQTQIANESTRPQAIVAPSQTGAPCSYPDICPPVTTPAPLPADNLGCIATSTVIATVAPYVSVNDNCGDERAALQAAGCTVVESVGIGIDIIPNDEATLPAQLAAADLAGVETAFYQVWTCGTDTVSLTTNL